MPRPKNKEELIEFCEKNYHALICFIQILEADQRSQSFDEKYLNRNIRDVIAHLHHWHKLYLNWYEDGMADRKPKMPAEGYTWNETKLLNQDINLQYQSVSLDEAVKLFSETHKKIMEHIHSHTESELFTKKFYKWTGSTSLASYIISSTSSHYAWALKLIKKNIQR